MRVGHRLSTWGDKSHFPAVALCSSASSYLGVVVVDAVVIAAQHGQIRRCGVSAIFMSIDVVHLAPVGGNAAIWAGAHKVFRCRHNQLFQRRETRLVDIDGASRGGLEPGDAGLAE